MPPRWKKRIDYRWEVLTFTEITNEIDWEVLKFKKIYISAYLVNLMTPWCDSLHPGTHYVVIPYISS